MDCTPEEAKGGPNEHNPPPAQLAIVDGKGLTVLRTGQQSERRISLPRGTAIAIATSAFPAEIGGAEGCSRIFSKGYIPVNAISPNWLRSFFNSHGFQQL